MRCFFGHPRTGVPTGYPSPEFPAAALTAESSQGGICISIPWKQIPFLYFLLAQIRKTNNTIALCYTNQDLDNLEAKRQQAIQDMLNGQTNPDAHTHSYTVSVVEPSCNAGGYTEYTCECGDKYRAEETAALAHAWGPWTTQKPATPQEEGLQKRTCSNCQAAEEKKTDKLTENHTHSYTSEVAAPTCTTAGSTVKKCSADGCDETTIEYVPATGHNFVDSWEVREAATCIANGVDYRVCQNAWRR